MTGTRSLAILSILACLALWLLAACGTGAHAAAPGSSGRKLLPEVAVDRAPKGVTLQKVVPPPTGAYLSAFADFGSEEDRVSAGRIRDYEALSGRGIAWAYFSSNWGDQIAFPATAVAAIRSTGSVPFVRMMPRSNLDGGGPDPRYSMNRIAGGDFDGDLRIWFDAARDEGGPLMVEFGTEVNGDWFPWNGRYNGGAGAGPASFRDAYRHIVDLARAEGALNLTWVFHVDAQGSPDSDWNAMRNYYPGDDYVDWLGISAYGAQRPDEDWQSFRDVMDAGYDELAALAPTKPIALLEFGVTDGYPGQSKAQWIADAFAAIRSGRYARLTAISWWHETFTDDDGTRTSLRIDSSPEALQAYRNAVADPWFVTELTLAGPTN